ncbi:hypothetical protein CDL12_03558 [Handroanthus impetiginosus]|uniref:Bifunctional inhibitor/plant lipid transfer protein/seed storage helical domain-containing protein n=1 Tax=Handroanthus impetiginosus TaxID=429701 RepID=A0A2G9I1S4_9LAMI|nr:hypothetical protein CDL12_03558 [Handroanthus impetiginosus]
MRSKVAYLAICVALMLLLSEVKVTKAATCNPLQLSPCAAAITSSSNPSGACCAKLKEQRPCLCQ